MHAAITYFHVIFVEYFMMFMVAWKKISQTTINIIKYPTKIMSK